MPLQLQQQCPQAYIILILCFYYRDRAIKVTAGGNVNRNLFYGNPNITKIDGVVETVETQATLTLNYTLKVITRCNLILLTLLKVCKRKGKGQRSGEDLIF